MGKRSSPWREVGVCRSFDNEETERTEMDADGFRVERSGIRSRMRVSRGVLSLLSIFRLGLLSSICFRLNGGTLFILF